MTPAAPGRSAESFPDNPYAQMVAAYEAFARDGRQYPLGTFPHPPHPPAPSDAPKVLIFSPHPDDEVIIGGLALRCMREAGWNVINVAVTQGSNKERQPARLAELRNCCDHIGFGLIQTAPTGLERIHPATREKDPDHWHSCVATIARILAEHQPKLVLAPHALDWNSTHTGTHHLVLDALTTLPESFACHVAETEFWGAMTSPNLMVELGADHLASLITALTFHIDEVRRNPYHLTLPAWMIDNVRRGAELVGGQGGGSPDFTFATLYRLRRWAKRGFEPAVTKGRFLPCSQLASSLFD